MAKGKYDKNVFEPTYKPWPHGNLTEVSGEEHGIPISIVLTSHDRPAVPETRKMIHDFDQFLWFIGSNPLDHKDFDAEIEYNFGEESEKHIITKPSVVYTPKGTVHCPLVMKRIGKPIFVIDIRLTASYKKNVL
jgi:hypothetical protein